MNAIKTYLTSLKKLYEMNGMSGLNFQKYVADNGKYFEKRSEPQESRPIDTQMKLCFRNAALASITHGYDYVEGYYTTTLLEDLVIEHAWNVDKDGKVIDYTAEKFDIDVIEYFGVSITRDDLWKVIEDKLYTKRGMTPLQVVAYKKSEL